jgi:16S rRNA (cytosine967-C5)-methyltransferase
VTDARRVAEEICADVRGGALLDPSFERRAAALEGRDRRWTQELVYGMLRTRARLDAYLDARVRGGLARLDPNIIDLLRLGAYQLLSMGSVPAYAAIAQTVEMVKRRHGIGASRIANAVLRRLDREREHLDLPALADPIDALALAHSHPRWLVARWVGRWGIEATARLLETNNLEAAMYIRPFGIVREQLEAMLDSAGVHVEDAPIATDSLRLTKPSTLTELSAFRQGLMFVQDPASTLVTRYAAIPAGSVVADLCAAPGGKALELSRQASMVVAADRSVQRLGRLRANIERLDARNIVLLAADAREPATTAMTATLLDAPCTGTGTFRRHPDARWRLKISDIAVMAAQQRALLAAAAANVRAGGLLIYSTCSLETEENDEQVDAFLGTHPHWRLEPPPPGTVPPEVLDHGLLRVLPHRHGTDGAFAARLRRTGA